MKSLYTIILMTFLTTGLAATRLDPLENDSISASLVTSMRNIRSNDQLISASVVTVFRGSAMALSDSIISFGESLEDQIFSYEIGNFTGEPISMTIFKKKSGIYKLKFIANFPFYNSDTGMPETEIRTMSFYIHTNQDGKFKYLEQL